MSYNIRVYGLWVENHHVLVADEVYKGMHMTKFPGGGHQPGESLPDCLIREFKEEMQIVPQVLEHFYTTDFYIASAFSASQQLLSIYYRVKLPVNVDKFTTQSRLNELNEGEQSFRWCALSNLSEDTFTFPIDKKVALMIKQQFLK
jgi:8-oxo-dGTP diphosphatase